MQLDSSHSTVQQWIDVPAGLAYISVGSQLNVFRELLNAIERLISSADWRPGMPVVEDLRRCQWEPPATVVEEWRAFVGARQQQLQGCRWAVVRRGENATLGSMLDAAAEDAAPSGVVLRQFTNMLDAHLWVKPPAGAA